MYEIYAIHVTGPSVLHKTIEQQRWQLRKKFLIQKCDTS